MIYRAVACSLFAAGDKPGQSFWRRAVLFGAVLAVVGWLAYRLAPHDWALPGSNLQLAALVFLLASLLNTLLFVLLNGYIASGLRRVLGVVQILPLGLGQVKLCYLLAYMPVVLLATSLTAACLWHFFAASLPPGKLIYLLLISHVVTVAYNLAVRTAQLRFNAQAIGVANLAVAALVANSIVVHRNITLALWVAGLLFGLQFVGIIIFARRQPHNLLAKKIWPVIQAEGLTVLSGLALRCLRTSRFVGSIVLVATTMLGLVLAVVAGKTLPFAAVAAATILLAGTLALEVRAISRDRYVLELLLYGQIGKWVAANWFLVGLSVGFFAAGVMFLATQWFPGQMGVSLTYFLSLSVCLAACGAMAASVIVPKRVDILAQIGSAVLYAIFAWVTFRLLNKYQGQALQIMAAEICLAAVAVHAAEKLRWLTSIRRGKNVF